MALPTIQLPERRVSAAAVISILQEVGRPQRHRALIRRAYPHQAVHQHSALVVRSGSIPLARLRQRPCSQAMAVVVRRTTQPLMPMPMVNPEPASWRFCDGALFAYRSTASTLRASLGAE